MDKPLIIYSDTPICRFCLTLLQSYFEKPDTHDIWKRCPNCLQIYVESPKKEE